MINIEKYKGKIIFDKCIDCLLYTSMPDWKLHMPWFCSIVIVLINVFLTFIGYLSVKNMLRGNAAEALRPYVPKKMKPLKIEKTKLWKKLNFGTKWNLRDIMRHKARSIMTLFGIIGCTLLILSLIHIYLCY